MCGLKVTGLNELLKYFDGLKKNLESIPDKIEEVVKEQAPPDEKLTKVIPRDTDKDALLEAVARKDSEVEARNLLKEHYDMTDEQITELVEKMVQDRKDDEIKRNKFNKINKTIKKSIK